MNARDARDATVAKAAALIASRLANQLEAVTRSIQQTVVTEITELRGDMQLVQLLRDTVAAKVDTFFTAIRNGIPVEHIEAPTAALEYARRLAQREVSANALVRAYRLGHRAALDSIIAEIRASELDPALSLDVYERMATISFQYIDFVSQRVVTTYQDERELWLGNRNTMRAHLVRDLLAGGDIDLDAAANAIGYPLRRIHVAIVMWCADPTGGDEFGMMERFTHKLAETLGAQQNPLFISVDRVTGWAWIPLRDNTMPDVTARIRLIAEQTTDAPYLAVGKPLVGLEGFRYSHQQAQRGRSLAIARGSAAPRVSLASDPGMSLASVLADNLPTASAWAAEVLGPLASDTDADERLRETLRVFLHTGSSHKAAAEKLHLHSNTVKYRVQRAIERRGRPITNDRLDVEVALLLCRWLGAAGPTPIG